MGVPDNVDVPVVEAVDVCVGEVVTAGEAVTAGDGVAAGEVVADEVVAAGEIVTDDDVVAAGEIVAAGDPVFVEVEDPVCVPVLGGVWLADGDVVGDDDGEKYGAIRGSACSNATVLYDLVANAHVSAIPLLIVGSTRGSDSSARTVAVQSK